MSVEKEYPRPPLANYSGLENNRGKETMKGPTVPRPDWVLNEDGTPSDSKTHAFYTSKIMPKY